MSFTVDDFQDLIRLLGERPEWRAELRRHVLSDELLELPTLVRAIAEQLAALTTRVDRLAEAQARTEQHLATLARRMDQLAEAQLRSEVRLGRLETDVGELKVGVGDLKADVGVLKTDVGVLKTDVGVLKTDVGDVKGEMREHRYRIRAGAYFARLARRLRLIDSTALADLLDEGIEQERLTHAERDAILAADLVLSGRRREDSAEIYLLVEVSVGIGARDVERAAERADLLARLDRPVVPVVAGSSITPDARTLSEQSGVQVVLDGRLEPPVTRP
jgi:septal ring factor EnvC (AmiA/AmiB activator)